MKILIKTRIEKNYHQIFSKFDRALFLSLAPPLMKITLERFDGCKKGDEVHIKMDLFGLLAQRWVSHITDDQKSELEIFFVDEGVILPPPLKKWTHIHRIQKIDEDSSWVIDDIDFSSGNNWLDLALYPALYAMFFYRKPIYKKELN